MKYLTIIFIFMNMSMNSQGLQKLNDSINNIYSKLTGTFGVAYINLQDKEDIFFLNGDTVFHAASTMKTPVLLEVMKEVADGKLNLTDTILLKNEFTSIVDGSSFSMDIGEDSGEGLYKYIGKYKSIRELLFDMITVSSNLATNILIEKVSAKAVMSTLDELGVKGVNVLRGVEDQKAYDAGLNNTVTSSGLASLFSEVYKRKFPTETMYNELIAILVSQKFNDLIPKYLPAGVKVAHKTGSITGVLHDSGLIFLPDGRAYVLVVLGKGIEQMKEAREAHARVSELVYKHFLSFPHD